MQKQRRLYSGYPLNTSAFSDFPKNMEIDVHTKESLIITIYQEGIIMRKLQVMKKTGCVVLATTMLAAMTGCGNSANTAQASASGAERIVVATGNSFAPYCYLNENNEVVFMMYPNPAENHITIESTKDAEVKIYSVNGQMLSQQNISEGINTIDISNLNAGMYFVSVNGTMVKIVKK